MSCLDTGLSHFLVWLFQEHISTHVSLLFICLRRILKNYSEDNVWLVLCTWQPNLQEESSLLSFQISSLKQKNATKSLCSQSQLEILTPLKKTDKLQTNGSQQCALKSLALSSSAFCLCFALIKQPNSQRIE